MGPVGWAGTPDAIINQPSAQRAPGTSGSAGRETPQYTTKLPGPRDDGPGWLLRPASWYGAGVHRRAFLRLAGALAASSLVSASPFRRALAGNGRGRGHDGPFGPLGPPDANGIMLPPGFRSRVLARSFEPVPGTGHPWHVFPDGGATFSARGGGWIYVSNAESFGPLPGAFRAGVGALRFDARGEVIDAYRLLEGTLLNCAGGATPWGTWLSCEEHIEGRVWECDPTGERPAVVHDALGTFKHEAAAFDARGRVYLSEDERDGRFYRYTPHRRRDLSAGVLEMAELDEQGNVTWHVVPDPNPAPGATRTRRQLGDQTTPFDGGEGLVHNHGHVFLTTKGDDRVWDYDVSSQRMVVLYDPTTHPTPILSGVDNITALPSGELFVAEDGGNMELVVLTRELRAAAVVRVLGQPGSEITGPAFDPSGRRLYFSSQRAGPMGLGITYEVAGPFHRRGFGRA